jgi:Flp pilus assembly protein TadG
LGPIKKLAARRYRQNDETGAELIEFALVVVILIALVYGIVFYGLVLGAKVTMTQASADGARAGIVYSTPSSAISHAEAQASTDVAWMGKGACNPSGTVITCVATESSCVGNTTNTCLTVTVTYNNYATNPLIPEAPGLGVFTPNNIVSTATDQVTTPTP